MKRPQANFIHAYYASFCVDYERVTGKLLDTRIFLIASVLANIGLLGVIFWMWLLR
jgi:hypothetical protein